MTRKDLPGNRQTPSDGGTADGRDSLSRRAAGPAKGFITPGSWRAAVAALLAGFSFLLYLTNIRPMGAWDCIPSRLVPFSLLRHGNAYLDEFPWLLRLGDPYFLVHSPSGHWLSRYPIATSVLVTPVFFPAEMWLERNGIADDDVRFRVASLVAERISAALLAAASVALLFLALCELTTTGPAAAIALVYATGTATWSISSQALWQHAGAELALAGLCLFLLRPDRRGGAAAAGFFAALGVMIRPTLGIFAALALVYVWRERRHRIFEFLAAPIAGAGALLAYNLTVVGRSRGGYGLSIFVGPSVKSLAGLLVSPNRGLFVYTPAAALALPNLRVAARRQRWLGYLAWGIAGYVLLFACWGKWWGGYNYGPRFLADVLPAIALLSVPAVERLRRHRPGKALLAALVAWSVAVQIIGVYFDDNSWNSQPYSIDNRPARLWDVGDLQIVRAANAGWHGFDSVRLLRQAFAAPVPAQLAELDSADLAFAASAIGTPKLEPGKWASIPISIENRGPKAWPAFSDYGSMEVALEYRWWSHVERANSRYGTYPIDSPRGRGWQGLIKLPQNVAPGASIPVDAMVPVPEDAELAAMEIRVIQVQPRARVVQSPGSTRIPVASH